MLIFWILNIILWALFAVYNWAFIVKKIDFHIIGAIISVLMAVLICSISFIDLEIHSLYGFISLIFISLSIKWNVFDIVLNKLFKKSYWYTGNINRNSNLRTVVYKNGKLDVVFSSWQFPVKWVLLLISIYLSI